MLGLVALQGFIISVPSLIVFNDKARLLSHHGRFGVSGLVGRLGGILLG